MINIILIWATFFLLFLITIIVFVIFKKKIEKITLKKYKEDLNKYNLELINEKFKKQLLNNLIDKNELNYIEDQIQNINKILWNELNEKYDKTEKKIKSKNPFKFLKINKNINDIFKKQLEYKSLYLKILFTMNEFSLNNEIKKQLIYYIKNAFSFLNKKLNNSNLKKIFPKSRIKNKLMELEDLMEELTKISVDENYFLEKAMIKINKSLKLIIEMEEDINFIVEINNIIEITFNKIITNFKKLTKENKSAFRKNELEWKDKSSLINQKIINLKINLLDLQKSLVKKETQEIKFFLIKMLEKATINIEAFLFIKNYNEKIQYIVKNYKNDEKIILHELEKFSVLNKKEKILNFKTIDENIGKHFSLFMKKINNNFKDYEPINLIIDLKNVEIFLSKYFILLENTYIEIKNIIDKNYNISKKIYQMNVLLLNIEDKIKNILPISRFVHEQKLNNYQNEVSNLIEEYRNNIKIPNEKKLNKINKLNNEILTMSEYIYSEAFKFIYVQKLIIILNKYSFSKNVTSLRESMIQKYKEEDTTDALRIAKKIIEVEKIYE